MNFELDLRKQRDSQKIDWKYERETLGMAGRDGTWRGLSVGIAFRRNARTIIYAAANELTLSYQSV